MADDNAADGMLMRMAFLDAGMGVEVIQVFDALAENPLIYCERHPRKDVRWRYPERFPYRVIYEVLETEGTVVVAAVIHAARHDRHWVKRI